VQKSSRLFIIHSSLPPAIDTVWSCFSRTCLYVCL